MKVRLNNIFLAIPNARLFHDFFLSLSFFFFLSTGDVTDIVEEVAENMAPWQALADERVLDGTALLFDDFVDHGAVKTLLFDYFTPENTRVDLTSSLFGVDGDFDDSVLDGEEKKVESEHEVNSKSNSSLPLDRGKAGLPVIEPRYAAVVIISSSYSATASVDLTLMSSSHC